MRELSGRELNRALLARQLLVTRSRVPVVRAVERLVALQAQYAPSPYLALWSRLENFRKEQLTRALGRGSVVKAGLLRSTLHVVTRRDFPYVAAAYVDAQRGRIDNLGVDLQALAAAIPDRPVTSKELFEIAAGALGTDDRWTLSFALRGIPAARLPPVGPWPHHKPSPELVWREPLPSAEDGALLVVRRYLAAYGPASRQDVEQFTGFRLGQIDPALDRMRRLESSDGRVLFDIPRGLLPPEEMSVPVRFLPPYDSIILAHRDRSRILPDEYYELVIRRRNSTTLATFLVDGAVAGTWRVERAKTSAVLRLAPFAPLPRRARRELAEEGERLIRFHEPEADSYRVRG